MPVMSQIGIGTGTATNNYIPIYGYYDYSVSQQIILQSEYADQNAIAGNITKIRWYVASNATSSSTWNTWAVYIGHTTKNSYTGSTDWIALNTATLVYDGAISPTNGQWMEVTLTTPFNSNGIDNLVVTVIDKKVGYTSVSTYPTFRSYTATNRGLYAYQDNNAINVNNLGASLNKTMTSNVAQIQFVRSMATCIKPTDVTIPSFTNNSVIFSWTASIGLPANGYAYEVRTEGNPGDAAGRVASGTTAAGVVTAIVNGLLPDTAYKFYVKAVCSGTDSSAWTTVLDFRTLCNVENVPYALNMNDVTTPTVPFCIGVEDVNVDGKTWQSYAKPSGSSFVGTKVMGYPFHSMNAANDWFYTHSLNLTGGQSYRLKFKYKDSGSWAEKLRVSYGTSTVNTAMTTELFNVTTIANSSNAVEKVLDFTPTTSGVYYIGFQAFSNANKNVLYVGDIELDKTPTCFVPGAITVNEAAMTHNTVTFSWIVPEQAPASGYEYEIRTSGNPGETAGRVAIGSVAAGALTATVNGLTPLTDYKIYIRSKCIGTDVSIWTPGQAFKTLCLPPVITSTTGATVCGFGQATLQAASNEGTFKWYESATSTTVLGRENTFITPELSQTTSFWVSVSSDNSIEGNVGKVAPTTSSTYTDSDTGVVFDIVEAAKITTADIYSTSNGTISVKITNSSGTEIYSTGPLTIQGNGLTTPNRIPINYDIQPGTGYRMLIKTYSGVSLIRESSGVSYPYTNNDNILKVTGGYFLGNSSSYYYFYNIGYEVTCTSERKEVVATVTPAPNFTLSTAEVEICREAQSNLVKITAGARDYNTFEWIPATEVTGNAITGWTLSPAETTTYTLVASQSNGTCQARASVKVVVKPTPVVVGLPETVEICPGTVAEITAGKSGASDAIFGTGTLATGTTSYPNPLSAYYGGVKTQMLYTKDELLAKGLMVGAEIKTIAFELNAFVAQRCEDFTIRIGHTTNGEVLLTDLNQSATLTTVYASQSFTPSAAGFVSFTLTTPFLWDGVSNVIIETVHNEGNSGNGEGTTHRYTATTFNSVVYGAKDNVGQGIAGMDTQTSFTSTSVSKNRPNIKLGFNIPFTFKWLPLAGLYTNPEGTTPYTGDSRGTVYVKTSESIAYSLKVTHETSLCEIVREIDVVIDVGSFEVENQTFCESVDVSDITINITGSGQAKWYSTGTSTTTIQSITQTGTYYVELTNGSCKTDRKSVQIEIMKTVIPVSDPNQSFCKDATVKDLVAIGTAIKWYDVSAGGTALASIDVLASGTYYASQTLNGCESVDRAEVVVTIYNTPAPTATAQSFCIAENKKILDLVVNGTDVKWYDVSKGGTALASTVVLASGTYYATQTLNGCESVIRTAVIVTISNIVVTPDQTDILCHGASTGKASVDVSGGVIPYSYSWDNGITSTENEATDLSAGTYTVTVTDSNGCTTTETFTIKEPTALSITPSQTDVLCHGASTGKVSAVVSGGVTPYSYSWDNGITSTENEATDLSAGTYTVTVTDANECTVTETFTIKEPTALSITPSQTDVLCHGALTGKGSVVVSGGVNPYSYSWDNGIASTTNEATDLSAGTYEVTVTDANGCTITESFTITEPTALSITPSLTDVLCHGASTGKASVVVTGGVNPYSYSWDNGITSTTNEATDLSAGTYEVTVTDANGCTITESFTITEPTALSITPDQTDVLCHGALTGKAGVVVNGGTAPYMYSWDNGIASTTNEATDLSAGTYKVAVTDANGCTITETFTITEPTALSVIPNQANVLCHGALTGKASVVVSGGVAPYSYLWNNGATSSSIDDLSVGTYTVTIKDANGCDTSEIITIIEPTKLEASVTQTNVNCNGGIDGTATVTATGGIAPYTYSWNTAAVQTNATVSNLKAGTYTATITDANGCETTASVTITEPTKLEVTIIQTNVSCYGGTDGSGAVTVSGGVPPYSYRWDNGATTSSIDNLKAGVYAVTITDANGCSQTQKITITEPALVPAPSSSQPTQNFCKDENKALVNLNITGTNIQWYDSATGGTALSLNTLLTSKIYYASQTVNGCESPSRKAITVNIYEALPLTSSSVTVCFNSAIQEVSIDGRPSGELKWYTNSSDTRALNPTQLLASGTYYVSTFVHNLCESARRAVQVTVLAAVPLPGTSQQVVCGSGTVADLTAQSISGAVLKWYATAQSTMPLAPTTNLLNGTYYVEQEVNGCRSGRKAVAVRVVSLSAPSMTNFVLCEGATVDNLQMAPTSVNYVWFSDATTSIMLPRHHTLTTGYYYVAYESLGCISKRTRVHVKINARPVAPTGTVRQHFTTKSMVSNIKVNESNVVWYASYEDAVSGTNPFSNQHPLEDQTTYYGVLVSKEGCTSYPLAVQVTVTLGLNDFDLASLKYYPNPVISELTVTYKDVIEQLDVYDLTGKWVKTQKYTSNLVKINLYDLALGTYMVRIKTNEGEQFIKIVKK